jgi:hypothetical protein
VTDSLVVGENIELIGAVVSTNPLCAGAVFLLQPGYDLGAPQPVTSVIGGLLLDGDRPFGYQAANRTITLPVEISVPGDQGTPAGFSTLAAAREVLLREVNQQTWTLRWTRDPGTGTPLPLLFDCFRAHAAVVQWGNVDALNRFPIGLVTLTFEALPYARSDQPVVADFPQPLAGRNPPPPPVSVDTFSGAPAGNAQWAASLQSPVSGGQSAFWDPGISPANNPSGSGLSARYAVAGPLGVNASQGWAGISQNTGTTTQVTLTTADAAKINIGDQFQLAGNALSGDDTGFEGGGIGGWAAQVNCSVSNTTAEAHTGTHSLRLSSTAAGTMSAGDNNNAKPCLPGDTVFASAWIRAVTVARGCQAGVQFLDVNFSVLATNFGLGGAVNDSTTAWTQVSTSIGAVAPASTAFALTVIQVSSAGGAAELHDVDDVVLSCRSSALLQAQIFTVTAISPPLSGFVNVTFTPAAAAAPVTGNAVIQTAPSAVPALTFWAGFGSSSYYKQWARLGGRVVFAVTLTDTYGTQLSFSRTAKCTGSDSSTAPRWHKIRIPVPYNPAFDYANVAGYTLTVTNRGSNDLRFTQLYLSALQAAPPAAVAGNSPVIRGALYDLAGYPGSARAPVSVQCQQTGTSSIGQFFTQPGTFYWTCPFGVTLVSVVAVGAGGAGWHGTISAGGGGGGGGGSGANNAVAVTAGNTYKIIVGAGGQQPLGLPVSPGLSSFTGDSVTVTGPAGNNASSVTGAAGGTAGTGGFAGGAGGNGVTSSTGGGGGGGSSGGSAAGGNTGGNASGSAGGAGGAAVTFGGSGGRGGTFGHGNGIQGSSFGGGSGGSPTNASGYFYPGSNGAVSLSYNVPKTFQSLVVHRPPPMAPESLSPVLPVSVGDPADGSVAYTLYPVGGTGLTARFGGHPSCGTYQIAVVASTWTAPLSTARTITVTITQFEQAGGASYTAAAAATITPSSLPSLSGTSAGNGPIVVLGELTLPVQDMPQDNTHGYFTATITDTIPTDAFSDILFLDTQGSTVMVLSPTGYSNMYLDEPAADRDIGLIAGSLIGRADAVSILDRATVAGGPLAIEPEGNPYLLVYCAEGAPQVQVHYFPRWHLDRTS